MQTSGPVSYTHLDVYKRQGRELTGLADSLVKQNPDIIILANELGSGVVPVDAFDRSWSCLLYTS